MADMATQMAGVFGQKVREARAQRGWSQAKLARELGLHHGTIQNWEAGESEPRLTQFLAVCRVFDWEPSDTRMNRNGATEAA